MHHLTGDDDETGTVRSRGEFDWLDVGFLNLQNGLLCLPIRLLSRTDSSSGALLGIHQIFRLLRRLYKAKFHFIVDGNREN